MKKIIFIVFAFFLILGGATNAQMMGNTIGDDHTAAEEIEGKKIWDKLQAKTVFCGDLTNDDFGALGEYCRGQMMGEAHAAMNQMMIQVHGEEGEEQIHVAMGKRLSGCDPTATFSGGTMGWMPMMNMMGGYNMMNWGSGYWFMALTWIIWTIVGIFAAIWLWQKITKK